MASQWLSCLLTLFTCLVAQHTVLARYHATIVTVGTSRYRRDVATTDSASVPKITDLYVDSRVYARFATVLITSNVVNTFNKSLDTTFQVQIPESAFISNFSMIVNGKTYIAQVFEKKEAQKKFDDAKSEGKSAGQVRHATTDPKRGMDVFKVDVNVGALTDAVFYLTYQELLEKRLGKYTQRIVVQPGQIVQNITVSAKYEEQETIETFAYRVPGDTVNRFDSSPSDNIVLKATPETRALTYKPTVAHQTASSSSKGLDGELVISYGLLQENMGGIAIVDGEYFVHYLAPHGVATMDKTVIFIIDISGSMSGRKIEQARSAMSIILEKLNSNDYFNIMLFDSTVEPWQEKPKIANPENIARAKGYVLEKVVARGSTNINDALLQGISSLRKLTEILDSKANVMVLLTDGDATAGETDDKKIRKNVFRANRGLAALYCLGFGFNLRFDFLKALAWENGGFARRIYEDVDAISQLEDFYLEIKDPLLTNVVIRYDSDIVDQTSTTQSSFVQYFDGSEMIVTGKTMTPNVLPASGFSVVGVSKAGKVNLSTTVITKTGTRDAFTEQLWAYMKIKDLLRLAAISEDSTASSLALNMSLEYNFVTPLTSFVMVEDVEDGNSGINRRKSFTGGGTVHDQSQAYSPGSALSVNENGSFVSLILTSVSLVLVYC